MILTHNTDRQVSLVTLTYLYQTRKQNCWEFPQTEVRYRNFRSLRVFSQNSKLGQHLAICNFSGRSRRWNQRRRGIWHHKAKGKFTSENSSCLDPLLQRRCRNGETACKFSVGNSRKSQSIASNTDHVFRIHRRTTMYTWKECPGTANRIPGYRKFVSVRLFWTPSKFDLCNPHWSFLRLHRLHRSDGRRQTEDRKSREKWWYQETDETSDEQVCVSPVFLPCDSCGCACMWACSARSGIELMCVSLLEDWK